MIYKQTTFRIGLVSSQSNWEYITPKAMKMWVSGKALKDENRDWEEPCCFVSHFPNFSFTYTLNYKSKLLEFAFKA